MDLVVPFDPFSQDAVVNSPTVVGQSVAMGDHGMQMQITPSRYVPNHHDAFLPDFSSPYQTGSNQVWTSTAAGNFDELFPNVGPDDVVVIENNVLFGGDHEVGNIVIRDGGTLRFDVSGNQRLKVTTIQVLEGGELQIGTEVSPHLGHAEIVFRDEAFDPSLDPGQYGHGLVVFGKIQIYGRDIGSGSAHLTAEVRQGESQISAAGTAGWQPGDQILVPDTRQLFYTAAGSVGLDRNEMKTVAIASDEGVSLTDSAVFDHLGARDYYDRLVALPDVANLTRNILLRSENPEGTRGHTMYIGRADVNIQNAEFLDLGRTQNTALDSTVFDAAGNVLHVGTNQISRYAIHFHHLIGPVGLSAETPQFRFAGNSVHSTEDNAHKWGITIHASNYGLIANNVVYNTTGAGIVTEDGTESFNTISGNFVARVAGTRERGKFSTGTEGSAFWFKRPNNYIDGNIATGADKAGFDIYGNENTDVGTIRIPSFKGADPHMGELEFATPRTMNVLSFTENRGYANSIGLDIWYLGHKTYYDPADEPVPQTKFTDLGFWNSHFGGVLAEQLNNAVFDNLKLYNSKLAKNYYNYDFGIQILRATDVVFKNSIVHNFRLGVVAPFRVDRLDRNLSLQDVTPFHLQDSQFRNSVNIDISTPSEDAMADAPPRRIWIDNIDFDSDPSATVSENINIRMNFDQGRFTNIIQDDLVEVTSYNGDPRVNFQVFYSEQAPDVVVPVNNANGPTSPVGAPVAGLTNQQLWDQYGMAIAGQVAPGGLDDGSRLPISGVIGLAFPLPGGESLARALTISPDTGVLGDHRTAANDVQLFGVASANDAVTILLDNTHRVVVQADDRGLWSANLSEWSLSAGRFELTIWGGANTQDASQFKFEILDSVPHVPNVTTSFPEDVGYGENIVKLSVIDLDTDDQGTFEIVGGNDDNIFKIDALSGQLSIDRADRLDASQPNHQLTIRVTDSVGLSSESIVDLTATRRPPGFWITQLRLEEIPRLTPEEIVFLSPEQILKIGSPYWMMQISEASRFALTTTQLLDIPLHVTGVVRYLSDAQQKSLPEYKIQEIPYTDLKDIHVDRIADISVTQMASVTDVYWMYQIPVAKRALLNAEQINGLDISKPQMIRSLNLEQRAELSQARVQQMRVSDYIYLPAETIVLISDAQGLTMTDPYWYYQMSPSSRAALTAAGWTWSRSTGLKRE